MRINPISGNTPGLPAQTTRRNLLAAIPAVAVLPALAAVPALAQPADPIIAYVKRWLEAYEAWNAAVDEPDGGNFDSPACLEQDKIKNEMEALIRQTPITTDQGFRAYCEYVAVDSYMSDETNEFPDLRRWQWIKIMEWAEARALVSA